MKYNFQLNDFIVPIDNSIIGKIRDYVVSNNFKLESSRIQHKFPGTTFNIFASTLNKRKYEDFQFIILTNPDKEWIRRGCIFNNCFYVETYSIREENSLIYKECIIFYPENFEEEQRKNINILSDNNKINIWKLYEIWDLTGTDKLDIDGFKVEKIHDKFISVS